MEREMEHSIMTSRLEKAAFIQKYTHRRRLCLYLGCLANILVLVIVLWHKFAVEKAAVAQHYGVSVAAVKKYQYLFLLDGAVQVLYYVLAICTDHLASADVILTRADMSTWRQIRNNWMAHVAVPFHIFTAIFAIYFFVQGSSAGSDEPFIDAFWAYKFFTGVFLALASFYSFHQYPPKKNLFGLCASLAVAYLAYEYATEGVSEFPFQQIKELLYVVFKVQILFVISCMIGIGWNKLAWSADENNPVTEQLSTTSGNAAAVSTDDDVEVVL